MKKIVIVLTVVLLIALMCSCNPDNEAVANENATINDLHNITENTQSEETNNLNETQSAEETTQAMVYENLVYTNMDLENNTDIVAADDVLIKEIPDDLMLGAFIPEKTIDKVMEYRDFVFYGETYKLDCTMTIVKECSKISYNSDTDLEYSIYKNNENVRFEIVNGSDKLINLRIPDKKEYDSSREEVSLEEARAIADNFMRTYSLAESLDDYTVTCVADDTIRFWYKLVIGGYEALDEFYMVGLNKNGDIYIYSDMMTGMYDQFIGKVTEEDVEKARRCLYPTVPNSYGYSDPYLQIGSDGNLYLCVSCFAEGEAWGEEYGFSCEFYTRVIYEE